MSYSSNYDALAGVFSLDAERLDLEGPTRIPLELFSFAFGSAHWDLHPPGDASHTDPTFQALMDYYLGQNPYSSRHFFRELQSADRDIPENRRFRYTVFAPKQGKTPGQPNAPPQFDRATLLCHGLNEKSWLKYLPWAARLAEQTHRPVILFPIAFHMNRAPAAWSDPREMMGVSRERRRLFQGLNAGSFANAALSHRVQFAPHRFLTSGLQSYHDMVDLATQIAAGRHPLFAHGTRLDFVGYSIGAALSALLLMGNPRELFSESRAFLFCGGSVMDQAMPVSRMIMDEAAYRSLERYMEALSGDFASALPEGAERLRQSRREIETFASLLFLNRRREMREEKMRAISSRVAALAIDRDDVFPPEGVRRSWTTVAGETLINVHTLRPEFACSHEQPFPLRSDRPAAVEASFDEFISRATGHLATAGGRRPPQARPKSEELIPSRR